MMPESFENMNSFIDKLFRQFITLLFPILILSFFVVISSCETDDDDIVITKPVVTTDEVSNISYNEAFCGGTVTSNGGADITSRGVCWNNTPNPEHDDFYTLESTGTGHFSSMITGLKYNTTYYIRAYAVNSAGIGYGEEKVFSTSELVVGNLYKGGFVFYLDNDGGGLVCAPYDQNNGAMWSVNCFTIGCNSLEVGTGVVNTQAIMSTSVSTGTAAEICSQLILSDFGDWFLPSYNELILMRFNLYNNNIADFSEGYYWSSSEIDSCNAASVYFGISSIVSTDKLSNHKVRAVRKF